MDEPHWKRLYKWENLPFRRTTWLVYIQPKSPTTAYEAFLLPFTCSRLCETKCHSEVSFSWHHRCCRKVTEQPRLRADQSRAGHFGIQLGVFFLIDFNVMAACLPDLGSVDYFYVSLYLFEPEYTDEEPLQFDERTTRLQQGQMNGKRNALHAVFRYLHY